jgi:hypothetical protein
VSTSAPALAEWGPLVTSVDIDQAVVSTIAKWLPTYLDQIENERGLDQGTLPRPKPASYANTLESDEFLDHMLPAVIVTTVSTVGQPQLTGDDSYITNWQVNVSSVLRAPRPPATRLNAALFEACVRRLLVQQGALGGMAKRTRWLGSRVAPVADVTGKGRYLAAGMGQYIVFGDVAAQGGMTGPLVPDQYPYQPLAPVTTVTTDVEAVTSIEED